MEIFHREPQSHPNVTSRWIIDPRLKKHGRFVHAVMSPVEPGALNLHTLFEQAADRRIANVAFAIDEFP